MANLLDEVIDAHGGLGRWHQLDKVHAHLGQDGAIWAMKRFPGALGDVFVTAKLHEQWVSHEPFLSPILLSIFTPDRVVIEEKDGQPHESMESPRASFAGYALETRWSNLQLVYFIGISMWTYLTQPFTYAMPGFETTEIEPWYENGERWRRLRVTWPERPVGHSHVQTLYSDNDGLIRRLDYEIDIAGGARGAHLFEGYSDVAGIMVPARHRIFPRDDRDNVMPDPLMVSIDVSQVEFTER